MLSGAKKNVYEYLGEKKRKLMKVEYLGKKGKFTGLTIQINKKEIWQFLLVLQSSVLFAPPGRRASRHRLYLLNQRSPYSRW